MNDTDLYRSRMWTYLERHHPEARVAWKGHGRTGYKYSTVGTYKQELRVDKEFFNHRMVLPEEIVADYDCREEDLIENAKVFIAALTRDDCAFSVWRTNGESAGGIHIHTMYDIPESVSDKKFLKQLILEHHVGDIHQYGLDTQVLGNHLIRFEGGNYDKLPPNRAGRKTLILQNKDPLVKNKIPQAVWDKYCSGILSNTLKGLRQKRLIDSTMRTPKSIQFIISPKFKEYRDGSKRALFVLASYYRNLGDDELEKLLREWSRYNSKEPLTDKVLAATIKSARNKEAKPVGERYRIDLLKSIGAYREVYGDED